MEYNYNFISVHRNRDIPPRSVQRVGRADQHEEIQKENQPVPRRNQNLRTTQQTQRSCPELYHLPRRNIRETSAVRLPKYTRRTIRQTKHRQIPKSCRNETQKRKTRHDKRRHEYTQEEIEILEKSYPIVALWVRVYCRTVRKHIL